MDFSNITSITIPEGSVERITETSTKRVLWEKGPALSPRWLITNSVLANAGDMAGSPVIALSTALSSNKLYADGLKTVIHDTNGDVVIPGPALSGTDTLTIRIVNDAVVNDVRLYGIAQPFLDNGLYIGKKNSESWYFLRKHWTNSSVYTLKLTTEPSSDTSVRITSSPERGEYLISGLKAGLCVIPTSVSSSSTLTYQSGRNFTKTCWASGIGTSGLYFGVTGSSNQVSYSVDGTNWASSTAFNSSSTRVLGVEYLSQKGKVCAISSNTGNVALSSDGINWDVRNAPFTNAVAYAYSPEYDVLSVFDKTGAYMTKNCTSWQYLKFPDNIEAVLNDMVYYRKGVFVGYEYLQKRLYFLSLIYPINAYYGGFTGYDRDEHRT